MGKGWQEKFYTEWGRKIKQAREERGWSIYDLAVRSGQQYITISRIEKGSSHQLHHIVWISDILELSIDAAILEMASITRAEARTEVNAQINIIKQRRALNVEKSRRVNRYNSQETTIPEIEETQIDELI